MSVAQYVDESVSRTKFDREVEALRALGQGYRARGWLLVEASFPTVLVVLCAARLNPPAVISGVRFDFSNYDAEPPSVLLVEPFTGEPYLSGQLPTALMRRVLGPPLPGFPAGADGQPVRPIGEQPLMQAASPAEIPFLCIAGVREYHEHPAHSGDAWDLHRDAGAGRLVRLLEVIDTYGVRPITGYNVELIPQVGFARSAPPE